MMDEPNLYPTKWSEFIGQKVAVEQIRVAAKSARLRRQPAGHLLLAHPDPGVGKTALARLAAAEARTNVFESRGKLTVGQARLRLSDMQHRDIWFIDEAHELGKAEWILSLLDTWHLVGAFGAEEQAHIQVVLATNYPEKLSPAVLSRVTRPPLGSYSLEDAAKIALSNGRRVIVPEGLPQLSKRNALDLASCANNNPRAIGHLLIQLRDLALTTRLANHDGRQYDLSRVFQHAGLTPDGLSFTAQSYLRALLKANGEVGEQALRSDLQEWSLTGVERVLTDKGYITKTRTGRTLTGAGLSRAKELAA